MQFCNYRVWDSIKFAVAYSSVKWNGLDVALRSGGGMGYSHEKVWTVTCVLQIHKTSWNSQFRFVTGSELVLSNIHGGSFRLTIYACLFFNLIIRLLGILVGILTNMMGKGGQFFWVVGGGIFSFMGSRTRLHVLRLLLIFSWSRFEASMLSVF